MDISARLAAARQGPADYFTGTVRVEPRSRRPIRRGCRRQRDLRARRAHGLAYAPARPDPDRDVGSWLGSARRAGRSRRSGRATWSGFPPGEKHWHGATPTTAMTHIAVQEKLNGKVVDWMEHVSDEQYASEPA